MAMKFAVDSKRGGDVHKFSPFDVTMDISKRGRYTEPGPERVRALAEDIRKNGQLTPIICRRLADKTVLVVAGFTRLIACRLIAESDLDFKINANVSDMDDETAFSINVKENSLRTELNAVDKAMLAQEAQTVYGMSRNAISVLLGCSVFHVANFLQLAKCPESILNRAASGKLPMSNALKLAKSDDVEAVLQAYDEASEGESSTAATAKAVRSNGVKVARGVKDLREVCAMYKGTGLSDALLAFLKGEDNDLEKFFSLKLETDSDWQDERVCEYAELASV